MHLCVQTAQEPGNPVANLTFRLTEPRCTRIDELRAKAEGVGQGP
jgi:hypothetical protein